MNQNEQNLVDVVKQLYAWRKYIVGLTFAAAVLAAIVSLLVPVYYKASTLFYAASPDLASPEQIFGTSSTTTRYYGTDSDRDRLFSIAKSSVLTDYLIRSFNLYEHYDIDSTLPKASYKIQERLLKHYTVEKTKYDALELTVEDQDPVLAAAMANAARDRINKEAQRLIRESQRKMLRTYSEAIAEQQVYLANLEDTLRDLRQAHNIYNVEAQSELLALQLASEERKLSFDRARLATYRETGGVPSDTLRYLQAAIAGREASLKSLRERLEMFSQGMSHVQMLEAAYEEISLELSELQTREKQLKTALESGFTALHVVEQASVPVVKSRPKRSLMVVMVAMGAFLFSVFGVLIYENFKAEF